MPVEQVFFLITSKKILLHWQIFLVTSSENLLESLKTSDFLGDVSYLRCNERFLLEDILTRNNTHMLGKILSVCSEYKIIRRGLIIKHQNH